MPTAYLFFFKKSLFLYIYLVFISHFNGFLESRTQFKYFDFMMIRDGMKIVFHRAISIETQKKM